MRLPEHDVEFASQYRWTTILDWLKGYDQPITRSGVANAHQYGVGHVPRLARYIHLGDKPLEPAT